MSKFKDIYWWFQHRFNPKHKYHLINTRLKPGYYDKDILIECGISALIIDYVEKEEAFKSLDWTWNDEVIKDKVIIEKAYNWFKYKLPKLELRIDKRLLNREDGGKYFRLKELIYKKTTHHLIEIIKIRNRLWT